VKPAQAVGYASLLWRQGHRALTVWASGAGRYEIARGEPVRDGWLRFKLSDADYRQLAGESLSAIVTVDREAGRILGVKFRGGRSGTS
jgi:hypothetical protein